MEFREDIVIYSDFTAVRFYEKHGFRVEPNLAETLKRSIQAENDTVCMAKGFNFEEELSDWAKKMKNIGMEGKEDGK